MLKRPLTLALIALFLGACNLRTEFPALTPTGSGSTRIVTSIPRTPTPSLPPPGSGPTVPAEAPYPQEGYGPDGFPGNVNPLTGLVAEEPSRLDRRPVGVKVNNYPRTNRPQWGLSLADIVYEYYHNNDLPRFHAIFYGNDAAQVGPIRSARVFDDYLVSVYKSIFMFASADSRILERLNNRDYADRLVYIMSGNCPQKPMCRYDPGGVNYLHGDTAAVGDYVVSQGGDNDRQHLNGMYFRVDRPLGGEDVSRLYVRYSYSAYLYWDYDPETGRYFRFQDTQEDIRGRDEGYALLTDRLTGEPIAADNVVVLVMKHFHLYYKPPEGGQPASEIVDMNFKGSGEGYAFRDGEAYPVTWVRPDDGQVLYLLNPDGTRYAFKPGTTWFQVVSDKTLLEVQEGEYRFQFTLR